MIQGKKITKLKAAQFNSLKPSDTCIFQWNGSYRQTSNISRNLECNKFVDHSDVVGAPPVGAAPTTSSFSI